MVRRIKLKIIIAAPIHYSENHDVLQLIAFLRKYSSETVLKFVNLNSKHFFKQIVEYQPDIVLYNIVMGEQLKLLEINNFLKNKIQFISVFWGIYAVFIDNLINEKNVDIVIKGEGPQEILNLINAYNNKSLFDSPKISGLVIKNQDGLIIKNELEKNILDINELPFDDRKLLYNEVYFIKHSGRKTFRISKGCPYNCTYCYNYRMKEIYGNNYYRYMSPKRAVDEMSLIKKLYPLSFIHFEDEIIFPNTEWLKEFSLLYKKYVDLPFNGNVRPNMINTERAKLLKKAGCYSINMAIEHGDFEYRKNMLNRNLTDEVIIEASKTFKALGILVACQNMLGLPDSNLDKDLKTLKLNIKLQPANSIIHVFQPYIGTKLGDYCLEKKYCSLDKEKVLGTTSDTSIIKQNEDYVLKLRDYFPFLVKCRVSNDFILKKLLSLPRIPGSRFLYFLFKFFMYKKVIRVKEPIKIKLIRIYTILRYGAFGTIKVNK